MVRTDEMDGQSPQKTRNSMSFVGSPRSPQLVNDSHLYEKDCTVRPYLPECWTDTKRMTSLMAPFRAREANPEGWDLKMKFWTDCITQWSLQTHSVVFSAKDVVKAFERGSKRPDIECIQLVMSDMKRNKNVFTLDEFKSICVQNSNNNWFNWGLNTFVVKPLTIGLSLVSNTNTNIDCEEILPEISSDAKIVMNQTLRSMSEEMNRYLNGLEDIESIRFDKLFNECKNGLNVDFETFEVIVNQLEIENRLKVFVDKDIKIVKIGRNAVLKESDVGVTRLEMAKELLENEISFLETEIESIREEAKVCVRLKNKEKAVLLLKKKKRVENNLSKKVVQMDNIDVLLDQLLNSSSHYLIVQAFQRANEALKLANTNHEDIETTMTDVEETLDVVNELISDVSRPLASVQTEDIEEELDDILNELNSQRLEESAKRVVDRSNEEQLVDILNNLSVNDQSVTEDKEEANKLGVALEEL